MRTAEDFSPAELRTLRRERKMQIPRLARLCGLTQRAIYAYEAGTRRPSADTWRKIKRILSEELPGYSSEKAAEKTLRPEFKFKVGHKYTIKRTSTWGETRRTPLIVEVFRYEGKRGIHHCFKEARGGWSRTYTDAQLIGKTIKEVQ